MVLLVSDLLLCVSWEIKNNCESLSLSRRSLVLQALYSMAKCQLDSMKSNLSLPMDMQGCCKHSFSGTIRDNGWLTPDCTFKIIASVFFLWLQRQQFLLVGSGWPLFLIVAQEHYWV